MSISISFHLLINCLYCVWIQSIALLLCSFCDDNHIYFLFLYYSFSTTLKFTDLKLWAVTCFPYVNRRFQILLVVVFLSFIFFYKSFRVIFFCCSCFVKPSLNNFLWLLLFHRSLVKGDDSFFFIIPLILIFFFFYLIIWSFAVLGFFLGVSGLFLKKKYSLVILCYILYN